jgi:carboxymethylenebutenolidase
VKGLADDLADHGFTVLAPDINFGELPESEQAALDHLGKADPNRLASLVLSSAKLLNEKSTVGPIGVVGFGMGGSLALWASVRLAGVVGAVVSFYGSQQIDFAGATSVYMIHLAAEDEFITEDEAAFMEATIRLEELDLEVIRHPDTKHGFGEPDGDTFHPEEFDAAWRQSLEFLEAQLKV